MASAILNEPVSICCERIESIEKQHDSVFCVLANCRKILVSAVLASHIRVGDEIAFPLPAGGATGPEIYVAKAHSPTDRCLYQAPIGYVTQPKLDRRQRHFICAQVKHGHLDILAIVLPCEILREYFYRLPHPDAQARHSNLYELLGIASCAAPAEIRLAFKLRQLELASTGAALGAQATVERAFNILGHPELRACYDALLADPEVPAIFPYGGSGSLVVSGERSRDGQTFFAHRILAFSPERRRRRFHLPLRQCDFYDDRALCRDARRKLEFWLDPALLHILWDPTWNQWKHLLATKIEVDATFVPSCKYRKRRGEWELVSWETALPSRLEVKLPADFEQQLQAAQAAYHRLGQYNAAFEQIRLCLEHRAVEKAELEKLCAPLRLPGDFDLAQISWRADYDPFFYRELSRRARRIYLFRNEYIFEVEKAVVVETPQLGHATYVFSKPGNMDGFLALYTRITKEDIRRNRGNNAEKLGFMGRVIHGSSPKAWLKEIRERLGDKVDYASATAS
ncbi:MAG: hypothetical protein ABSE40_20405 [Candidatus Sulfotelmatobacter sp.]|jgi:hypothetical protein